MTAEGTVIILPSRILLNSNIIPSPTPGENRRRRDMPGRTTAQRGEATRQDAAAAIAARLIKLNLASRVT